MRIVEVTDRAGAVVEPEWLERAQAVHRQLRPQLAADYGARMRRIFATGGRMAVAAADDRVIGVAVYRVYENTVNGRKCYVDDLVSAESERSRGVGHALMEHLDRVAREMACDVLELDSGVHRGGAHKFYFREGFVIASFNFKRHIK